MRGDIKLAEVRTEIPGFPKLPRCPGPHFLNQKPTMRLAGPLTITVLSQNSLEAEADDETCHLANSYRSA